jgi:hypothetical protein
LVIVFLVPVVAKALLWSFEEPRNWHTARWSSAGILPEVASDHEARIVVFAARTQSLAPAPPAAPTLTLEERLGSKMGM